MDRFPLMIFRAPGLELIHGVLCETRIVQDEDELDDAIDDGWQPSAAAAGEVVQAARAAAHAAVLQREADAAAEAARAIRAPLEAEIEGLKVQLKASQDAHAKANAEQAQAVQDLADERAAHAKTKAAAATPPDVTDKAAAKPKKA